MECTKKECKEIIKCIRVRERPRVTVPVGFEYYLNNIHTITIIKFIQQLTIAWPNEAVPALTLRSSGEPSICLSRSSGSDKFSVAQEPSAYRSYG